MSIRSSIILVVLLVVGSSSACGHKQEQPTQGRFERLRQHAGGYIQPAHNRRAIVFVNGIFGDAVSTWTNENTRNYWPELMSQDKDADFQNVDIYVHSFDSPKLTTAQNIDELAGRLKDFLASDRVIDHDQVVFVCHSMGGLVVRAYLLKEHASPKKFPMIYFYSTPTNGANVTEIAKHVSSNVQLKDMLPLKEEGYVGDLSERWIETYQDATLNYPNNIASFCAYEKLDTYDARIVEKQSAIALCNRETRGIVADHIDIVKPADDRADAYIAFKAAYRRTFGSSAQAIARALSEAGERHPFQGVRESHILGGGDEDLTLKGVKAVNKGYFRIDCGQTVTGDLPVKVNLAEGEKIVGVVPTVENKSNISKSSVALVVHEGGSSTIRYSLTGAQANAANRPCPTNGHAEIVANFIVSRQKN